MTAYYLRHRSGAYRYVVLPKHGANAAIRHFLATSGPVEVPMLALPNLDIMLNRVGEKIAAHCRVSDSFEIEQADIDAYLSAK